MSGFGESLEFEKFQLGDWWDKIKENPEQLLIGAGDPISAGLWGSILDKEYEPFVNVLGGPYGGQDKWSSGLGEAGGVYRRARESGLDTSSAEGIHDIAEVIAATMALTGGGGGWGGGGGAPTGGEGALTGIDPSTFAATPRSYFPLEGAGGGGGLFGGGGFDFGAMDWSNPSTYMDLMGSMPTGGMSGGGGRAQQASDPPPQRTIYPTPSMFSPQDVGSPDVYAPQRVIPFGLLMQDEEEMQKLFGGIL